MKQKLTIGAIVLAAVLCGCEHQAERYVEMVEMHAESITLPDVPADSVLRFAAKFRQFINQHPDAQNDPLYPLIQRNIEGTAFSLQLKIDPEWDGEDVYQM